MHSRLGTESPRSSLQVHDADVEMVRSVLSGDRAAIDRLVQRLACVPRILAAKNQRLGSQLTREDLLDLVQDVLALVWRKLPGYRGDAALESWIYPFCVLELLNAERRKRLCTRHFKGEPPDEPVAVDPPPREEGFARLYEGLARLSPPQASCIRLRCFQGAPFEEIAERLSIPISTAKTHYYRGMQRLRALLGPFLREVQ